MTLWHFLIKRGNQALGWLQWLFSGRRLMGLGGMMLIGLLLGRSWYGGGINRTTRAEATIVVGEQRLNVELATTPAEIEQGLSDRTEIGSDGMLFVLSRPAKPRFWMLRMQFALDIVWLDQDKIVQIDADVPPPSQTDGVPTVVQPTQPIVAVLEVPAGTAERLGWSTGTPWKRE